MFADLDETIRNLLIRDVPLDLSDVDISFEAPDRDCEIDSISDPSGATVFRGGTE